MELKLEKEYYGVNLIFKEDHINYNEQISQTIYGLKEDGKIDFNKRLGVKIKEDERRMIYNLFSDMVDYEDEERDYTELINQLIGAMPQDKAETLIKKLYLDFITED